MRTAILLFALIIGGTFFVQISTLSDSLGQFGKEDKLLSNLSSQANTGASTSLDITYAKTPEERYTGLSDRSNLPADQGLMLVYDMSERHGIVMREMNFSIDIIWLDKTGTIVDIKPNAKPSSYTSRSDKTVFRPDANARYVLEVAAGTAQKYDWSIDDSLKQYLPDT